MSTDRTLDLMSVIDSARREMVTVPNKPKTPTRTLRVTDELWFSALEIASERDEKLSDVMRSALEEYVKIHTSSAKS